MTWKKVNNSDAGTATKHGGNDIDKITDAFNGVDVSDPIKYNTDINTLYANTNAAGDILKSNGTKFVRLARGTANQVLSVNAGGTDLAWGTPAGGGNVSTTGSNTYGDFDQIFRSGRLDVRNPANTFSYSITGAAIAADRALTLPLLTAGDTVATEAFSQTLTNKTINATNNTVTDTSTAAGDLLKSNGTKFVRLARGSANQQIRTNAGATDIEWFTPTSGTAREDLCAFFSMARKTDIPSTYTDLEFLTLSPTGTQHVAGSAVYETSIDFTGKTQVKAQWIHGRNGTGTHDVRVVDSSANVLFASTGHTTDGRKTVALASLPGWATGVSTIKIQGQSTVTTDDISIVDMAIYLK